eukprot:scpid112682/ scgid8859/ 
MTSQSLVNSSQRSKMEPAITEHATSVGIEYNNRKTEVKHAIAGYCTTQKANVRAVITALIDMITNYKFLKRTAVRNKRKLTKENAKKSNSLDIIITFCVLHFIFFTTNVCVNHI